MMSPRNHPDLWRAALPRPKPEGNKYDRGHLVIAGGPAWSTGATKLSAMAALRIGAGLVSVVCDATSLPIYAASFQAVMTKPLADYAKIIADPRVTALLLGPGLGTTPQARALVEAALATRKSLVLDADALSLFAKAPHGLFHAIGGPCLLTPHEGEFTRLFGQSNACAETRAAQAAVQSGAVVLLKGARTIIASPTGELVVSEHATPHLATAGTGDVLAGMAAGLIAQGMPVFEAALAACWMHGEAAVRVGPGLISEDIAPLIPAILRTLQ